MPDPGEQQLLLSDWLVLSVVCEQPAHGFAIAGLVSADGSLGRVWQVSKPAVYAAMARLERLRLVQMAGEQRTSQGPARSLVKATQTGQTAARKWLHTPVAHGRDVRSELMIKLALLERAGADPWDLLTQQRAQFVPPRRRAGQSGARHRRNRAHPGAVAAQDHIRDHAIPRRRDAAVLTGSPGKPALAWPLAVRGKRE